MPGAFLEHSRFARHIYIYIFKTSMSLVCKSASNHSLNNWRVIYKRLTTRVSEKYDELFHQ